jgi:hypothetical protein
LLALARGQAQSVEWMRQFGGSRQDTGGQVSADRLGNVYVSGITHSDLGGPAAGRHDAFLSKFDAAGTLQWTRQLGTSAIDASHGVSADGLGNVYLAGATAGNLAGINYGESDAFVSKFDTSGTLQWTRQFGTNAADHGHGVSADGMGNVYVSGYTKGSLGGPNAGELDAFVRKYDPVGTLLWSRQLGTDADDLAHDVSADQLGGVYISGVTGGSLEGANAGESDAFVSKYDTAGTLQWTRQLGTSEIDDSHGVSADGLGNVYIAGHTQGSLGGPNAGNLDPFISKYDVEGTLLWTRQMGTAEWEFVRGISVDDLGNIYIVGRTNGSLGDPNASDDDVFISKYDAAGTLLWTRQFGTNAFDAGVGVSADGLGNVYFSGVTYGRLVGPGASAHDAFVAKIRDVPEPATGALLLLAALPRWIGRRSKDIRPRSSAARSLTSPKSWRPLTEEFKEFPRAAEQRRSN